MGILDEVTGKLDELKDTVVDEAKKQRLKQLQRQKN